MSLLRSLSRGLRSLFRKEPGQPGIGRRTKTANLPRLTHLMDDANPVPGTERNRYLW
jgi:hypothetical protein